MDGRTILGKTVTFLVICIFMAVFLLLFGTNYVLVGITVATAAMIMLAKDMSVRPLSNLTSIMVFMVMMMIVIMMMHIKAFLFLTIYCYLTVCSCNTAFLSFFFFKMNSRDSKCIHFFKKCILIRQKL